MVIINKNSDNALEWLVLKGLSDTYEDFSLSIVTLYVITNTNKIHVPCTYEGEGIITAALPKTLDEGVYDTELVWIKNHRSLCRTSLANVFRVADSAPQEAQTIKQVSTSYVYGYDGMSSYELACMYDPTITISEKDWVEGIAEVNTYLLNKFTGYDAALNDRYTKEEASALHSIIRRDFNIELSTKANITSVYTKEQIDSSLATKASTASVTIAQQTANNAISAVNTEVSARTTAINNLRDEMDDIHNSLADDIATRATLAALNALTARVEALEAKHTINSGGEYGGGSIQQPIN